MNIIFKLIIYEKSLLLFKSYVLANDIKKYLPYKLVQTYSKYQKDNIHILK